MNLWPVEHFFKLYRSNFLQNPYFKNPVWLKTSDSTDDHQSQKDKGLNPGILTLKNFFKHSLWMPWLKNDTFHALKMKSCFNERLI